MVVVMKYDAHDLSQITDLEQVFTIKIYLKNNQLHNLN